MVNESGAAGEWGQESDEKIPMIVARWWERNWNRTEGFGDEGDNGWGYGRETSGCSGDIGRRGIGSNNALGDGRSDMLDDSAVLQLTSLNWLQLATGLLRIGCQLPGSGTL